MRRLTKAAIVIVFVLGLVLGIAPQKVQALPPPTPSIADGTWNTGVETPIDLTLHPAPYAWYQLPAAGVTISAPGTICHEFRGGQFGWVADVRELVNGTWVKVETTQGWLNGNEAAYAVCATAPEAGTYALFTYYIKPAVQTAAEKLPRCDGFEISGIVLNADMGGGYGGLYLYSYPPGEDPTTWTYKVLSFTGLEEGDSPAVILSGRTGSFEPFEGHYMGYPVFSHVITDMRVRIYTGTCYIDWDFVWS